MSATYEAKCHRDLSNDMLNNAKTASAAYNASKENRFIRSACHSYYYSIYHRCLSKYPSLGAERDSIHSKMQHRVEAKDQKAGKLYRKFLDLRHWADYKPTPFVGLDAPLLEDDYGKLAYSIEKIDFAAR